MSWFDTSGIANLAKSALKEAQKTIDKALDIKEEEGRSSGRTQKDEQLNNFFATWGVRSIEEGESESAEGSASASSKDQEMRGVWGSFTGSFFDNPRPAESGSSVELDPAESFGAKSKRRGLPISDGIAEEAEGGGTMQSLLRNDDATPSLQQRAGCGASFARKQRPKHSNDRPAEASGEKRRYSASEIEGKTDKKVPKHSFSPVVYSVDDHELRGNDAGRKDDSLSTSSDRGDDATRQDSAIRLWTNRPSTASMESDEKKSSDSVEILDSLSNTNTNCTTTPESEITSPSISTNPTQHDTNRNSDSVEILSDSLVTSPSSVEIIADSKSDCEDNPFVLTGVSGSSTEHVSGNEDGVFSSNVLPHVSPISEESREPRVASVISCSDHASVLATNLSGMKSFVRAEIEKESPESATVVGDVDELDEVSQAEDSYTSASETTVMTIMDATMQLIETTGASRHDSPDKREHDSCSESAIYFAGTNQALNAAVDLSREKHSLHLPVEPITTQPMCTGEPIGEAASAFGVNELTCEPQEVNACVELVRNKSQDYSADCPEQYLILTDSSCEGTLVESSSEDNPTAKTNAKIVNATLTTSSYVQNMLADAMVEKGEIPLDPERHRIDVPARENSPISSESRSDLVKIGSDQTSGQTSGDELETTTSSDIEIISSPNGDSSSTQSCQSPANLNLTKGTELLHRTLKTRGHSRELSEISMGSDEANFEVEKLLRQTQEMTEILQVRESKLIDVSRMNMELHEQNIHLKKQLESIEMRPEHNQELNRITEDYTMRLSALEKKFQQTISERDSLREQIDSLKHEASVRMSSHELLSITAEKDGIIRELRQEGEKLSKQQLQHGNIIKKLRVKEKENETLLKSQKEQLDEQVAELERLKRSLYAKEEIERTQIEAVHTLTARVKKQETEILNLQEQLDNSLHKMDAYKTTHEAIKVDSDNVKNKLAIAEEELKKASENAEESCQLAAQVEDLRLKLRHSDEAHVKNVETLKKENNQLLKRLEISEARNEELSESVTLATKPLLRQLEQLQSSFAVKMSNFTKQEKHLTDTIAELQSKLEGLVTSNRSLVEENLSLKKKLSSSEAQIKRKDNEKTQADETLQKLRTQYEQLEKKDACNRKTIEKIEKSYEEQTKELKREIQSLNDKLSVEKAATNAERRKNNAILEQQSTDQESRLSPTLSIGRDSVSSTSSVWPAFNESLFESGSGRFPSVYDSLRAGGNSTSMIENLQAQVKQRDGEIQQLQWEISRRNNERDILNMELSSLTFKIEELTGRVSEVEALNESLDEIQTRYDALLQMYGEKIEETQELRLDLEDVKEMYKTQIDQLLKRDTAVNN